MVDDNPLLLMVDDSNSRPLNHGFVTTPATFSNHRPLSTIIVHHLPFPTHYYSPMVDDDNPLLTSG